MRAWKLGTAFGIGIFVHWSFLLLVMFAAYVDIKSGGNGLYGVVFLGMAFGCVVLHELGHALTARRFGIATRNITLYPIGGVAQLERMSEKPLEEFLIAIAGPAVNVVILLLLAGPFLLSPENLAAFVAPEQHNILVDLVRVNLGLLLFNMLPAFPMDGGRVLRALLVPPLGRLVATEVAATIGALFAIGFAILGVLYNPILLLIAFFGYFAGRQELAAVREAEFRRRWPWYGSPHAGNGAVLDALPADGLSDLAPRPDGQRRVWVVRRLDQPVTTYWIE